MSAKHEISLDTGIRNWVLLPIMLAMVLIGVLRHYVTLLMQSPPKVTVPQARETSALNRLRILRLQGSRLPHYSCDKRRAYFDAKIADASLGVDPKQVKVVKANTEDEAAPSPMQNPAQMEQMMEGMKKNMVMMVPQMLIMAWVNYAFTGFVIAKLPFPLTLRFKAMLQRGIETSEMDVAWVSSLSWYFLNLFGLRGIFGLILGEDNAADGMRDMQNMAMPAQQPPPGQAPDIQKLLAAEKEALDLTLHEFLGEKVELRLIERYKSISSVVSLTSAAKKSK